MANPKSESELWESLLALDDDLLDPDMPEGVVHEAGRSLGVDPAALASRAIDFISRTKEQNRLSWQARARERKDQLATAANSSRATVPSNLDRAGILARLAALKDKDPYVGTAISIAARKRKPEESTDDELRALLEEMEALRSIESSDK